MTLPLYKNKSNDQADIEPYDCETFDANTDRFFEEIVLPDVKQHFQVVSDGETPKNTKKWDFPECIDQSAAGGWSLEHVTKSEHFNTLSKDEGVQTINARINNENQKSYLEITFN